MSLPPGAFTPPPKVSSAVVHLTALPAPRHTADPAGLYFGTNTGSVFASRDEGESWEEVVRHLPTILSVEVLERA